MALKERGVAGDDCVNFGLTMCLYAPRPNASVPKAFVVQGNCEQKATIRISIQNIYGGQINVWSITATADVNGNFLVPFGVDDTFLGVCTLSVGYACFPLEYPIGVSESITVGPL